ncbi:NAD-dependent epimerase/dehydratase family protein [Micromonospora rubida]
MTPTAETPVRLSAAVMTHPKRLAEAEELAATDARGRVQVIVDPEPDGRPTALRVAPLSWSCVEPDATHHLVFQDDVVVADGFYDHAERAAVAVPDEAIAFYAGWEARNGAVARLAALTGAEWAYALQEHVPCQALMLPAELARGYAKFQEEHGDGWPYDVVVQRYLNARGVRVRFCTPTTVQHTEMPSLAGNAYHGFRQATRYVDRVTPSTSYECADFPVVPFYQYGDARCAVRYGTEWEYLETERHLGRIGLLDRCLAGFTAPDPAVLPERVSRAVWLTGFAIGVVTAAEPEPEPSVAADVMSTLGTGGLCEEYTVDDLLAMAPPVRDLALAALREGRAAGHPDAQAATGASGVRVAVTGGEDRFARQFARLLGDLGYQAEHLAGPPAAERLDGVVHAVHLGAPAADPRLLDEVLAAAGKAGVERLLYVGSAAVYRGSAEQAVTEDAVVQPPSDPTALQWWHEEQRCRDWGAENGIAVQVLRLADPVGPHAPADTTSVRWIHLAWTRRPLLLNPHGVHQVLDYRDMAGAVGAVLAAAPSQLVLNVASGTYDEEELAGLLAEASRRTPWEQGTEHEAERWTMATGLIEAELGWRASAPAFEGMRALAQWYACDIHYGEDLQ